MHIDGVHFLHHFSTILVFSERLGANWAPDFRQYTFPAIHDRPGNECTPSLCQKVLGDKPRFACVFLGKCRFWLISFDGPFCLKRNLEGNIVSWIAGTYPNFKKFYTSEVEKSPKNHLSLRNAGKN